ncbi:MAG: hypothetical protein EOO40_12950, partial [Deltaproteobacteria bacterium]
MDSTSSSRVRHPATLALLLVPLTLPAYAQQVPDGAASGPAAAESSATGEQQVSTLDQVQVVGQAMTYSKTNVSKRVLEHADRLLAVAAFCIGTNQIDLEAAADHGVAVFNAPYSNTRS